MFTRIRVRFMCWLARHMGRRRVVVFLFGLLHIAQGLTLLHDPGNFRPDEAVFYATFPLPLRVGLWIGTGLLTAVFACHPRTERLAWTAVMVMPAERFLGHLLSLIAWIVPGGQGGSEWASAYMLFWGSLVVVLLTISGWRDDIPERLEDAHAGR